MAEVIVLGSGTGIPSLRRASPGLALITGSTQVVLDTGPGTLRTMLEAGIGHRDVDLLMYTHLHPDHTADLVPFLFACRYSDLPRERDLLCLGGPGFNGHVDQLRGTYGSWIEAMTYRLSVREVSKEPFSFRDLRILSAPVAHLPGSVAYRIEFKQGRSVTFSGDTDYCAALVELAGGTDLLVLECSFPDGKKVEGHLTPSLAGRIAAESRCKRALLTHLYPVCDHFNVLGACQEVFKGEILLGQDLMRVRID